MVKHIYKNTQRQEADTKMDEVGTQWDEGIREDRGGREGNKRHC